MTESEAKGFIQGKLNCMNKCDVFDCKGTDECENCNYCYSQGTFGEQRNTLTMAIQALEEIPRYRDLGTVDEMAETQVQYNYLSAKIKKFEAIGTVEEFKALKEKNEPKKTVGLYGNICPSCSWVVSHNNNYCEKCGQHLKWE